MHSAEQREAKAAEQSGGAERGPSRGAPGNEQAGARARTRTGTQQAGPGGSGIYFPIRMASNDDVDDAADGVGALGLSDDSRSAAAEVARARQLRRRLSVSAAGPDAAGGVAGIAGLDGAAAAAEAAPAAAAAAAAAAGGEEKGADELPYASFASLSRVGFVPFNSSKVNQDRAASSVRFCGRADRAVFAAYDGHGQVGHEVSTFVSRELPRILAREPLLESDPPAALVSAFEAAQRRLTESGIVCTYSGSTAVLCLLDGGRLYTANAGDSRAVLARERPGGGLEAVALSDDQKPDRPDERERIEANRGRVQACRAEDGRDIGPMRVWLRYQDVPGLAMSRSFGDLVAASVGVIATPEVSVRDVAPEDRMLILASDGVWEFISSEEAVAMVEGAATPQEACLALVNEATRRWRREEEVIDDITALVVFLR